ncbi:TauD/TfdA family dioxygenase [Pseudomonadales bacterium]|jgi:taurine dioxygenase|nr:TauD/TfdA family dioxygenase [Pseudomonadales bacterium]
MKDPAETRALYNTTAIDIADKLNAVRKAVHGEQKTRPPLMDALFPAFNRVPVGVAREYEAMGHRAVSAALEALAEHHAVQFEHLATTLGTVIHGIDLKQSLSPEIIALIRQTLLERKVIFFRGQDLSEDQQVAFGRCFGELDAFPFGKPGKNPYILEILHNAYSPGTENSWHTDVTWMECPSLGSIAQCTQAPPYGGDTLFADSHAAYLGLPTHLQEQIQDLSGINDYRVFLNRGGVAMPEDLIKEVKTRIPFGVAHPLVRTHPETQKPSLYLHGGFLRQDALFNHKTGTPLAAADSLALVAELLKQHSRPEYQCRFQWTQGAIAFWDNRAVQHYATSDYYPHERRLRRVTVSGCKPY